MLLVVEANDLSPDQRYMDLALEQARRCLSWGDVPIGAVVVRDDEVLGAAGNERRVGRLKCAGSSDQVPDMVGCMARSLD